MRRWVVWLLIISFSVSNISPCFAGGEDETSALSLAIKESKAAEEHIEHLKEKAREHLDQLNKLKPHQLKAVMRPVLAVWRDALRLSLSEAVDGHPFRSESVTLLSLHSEESIEKAIQVLNAIEAASVELNDGKTWRKSSRIIDLVASPASVSGTGFLIVSGYSGIALTAALVAGVVHVFNFAVKAEARKALKTSIPLLTAVNEMWFDELLSLSRIIPSLDLSQYVPSLTFNQHAVFLNDNLLAIAQSIINQLPDTSVHESVSQCTTLLLTGMGGPPRLALPPGQPEEETGLPRPAPRSYPSDGIKRE